MTHRFFSSLARRAAAVLGGTVLASALLGAPAAQAQNLRGLSNADGTIQCEYGDVGGTYIRCHSPGDAPRALSAIHPTISFRAFSIPTVSRGRTASIRGCR